MRDGVRIAIDVLRPAKGTEGRRLPTVLQQTRYWRTPDIRFPVSLFASPLDYQGIFGRFKTQLVERGYVWVDVDTRGSGASFGNRSWDYSPDEIQDGGEIMSWIAAQPWSNGTIATAGASYTGSTAEFAMINRHPALKAVINVSSEFDQYTDILAPGGVPLTWWLDDWGAQTAALDRNEIPGASWKEKLASDGVAAVFGHGRDKVRAIAEHRDNYDFRELNKMTYRDDFALATAANQTPVRAAAQARQFAWLKAKFGADFLSRGVDLASGHAYLADLKAQRAPTYAVAGWFDGTYANAAAKRFNTIGTPGDKLILGPWDHTQHNISPFTSGGPTRFDLLAELTKFLDGTVNGKPAALASEAPVHYYTMGAECWNAADSWPPRNTPATFYFASGQSLSRMAPKAADATDDYVVDMSATTGRRTRFNTLMGRALVNPYPNRAEQDKKLLVYDTASLLADTEVTGHPLVWLNMAASTTDAAVFVYLEDVAPDGAVTYVTEGEMRALHRKISDQSSPTWQAGPYHSFRRADAQPLIPGAAAELAFELLPTSYLFKAGHRIRIAIAGADAGHFARVPADTDAVPVFKIFRERARTSRIVLPVVPPHTGGIGAIDQSPSASQ
jgi:putative CocE/NonD family hydrolase